MSGTFNQQALVKAQQAYIDSETFTLHFYQNDFTPTVGTDVAPGDVTEASYSGYAPIILDSALFTVGANADAVYDEMEEILADDDDQDEDIFGYYLTDASDTIAATQRFGETQQVRRSGDRIAVRPVLGKVAIEKPE